MVKDITNPYLSPSRAVVLVRERAKRRQGCIWAGRVSSPKAGVSSGSQSRQSNNQSFVARVAWRRETKLMERQANWPSTGGVSPLW